MGPFCNTLPQLRLRYSADSSISSPGLFLRARASRRTREAVITYSSANELQVATCLDCAIAPLPDPTPTRLFSFGKKFHDSHCPEPSSPSQSMARSFFGRSEHDKARLEEADRIKELNAQLWRLLYLSE